MGEKNQVKSQIKKCFLKIFNRMLLTTNILSKLHVKTYYPLIITLKFLLKTNKNNIIRNIKGLISLEMFHQV